MSDTHDGKADAKRAPGWAEHTVVANLPRLLPGIHRPLAQVEEPRTLIGMPRLEPLPLDQPPPPVPFFGRPLAEIEEPRTVVGSAPTRAFAESLIARYGAAPADAEPPPATDVLVPQHQPWFRRIARFAREDFERAPRIVRLLLPALPLVAAATTFLDVDPSAPSLSRAVAVAATARTAAPAQPPEAALTLPTSNVTIPRHPGRTLAAEAADAAARGDRTLAIAIYAQLAREHPDDKVYASAARILMAKD